MQEVDLLRKRYGALVVTARVGSHKGRVHWLCICDCGGTKVTTSGWLNYSRVGHCGCMTGKNISAVSMSHGQSKHNQTGAYVSWTAMKWRCRTLKMPTAKNYRLRGITYCERWEKFENFFADMGPRPIGKSLDRRNNDLGYSKDNCRWATAREQSRNRRNVKERN